MRFPRAPTLRPLAPGDEALFCGLYRDPATMRFVGRPLSRAQAAAAFDAALGASRTRHGPWFFAVLAPARGQPVGVCAIQPPHRSRRCAEIGIMLARPARGRGLARRCVSSLIRITFEALPIDEVWVQYRPANAAARRLFTGIGFVPRTGWRPRGSRRAHTIAVMQRSAWHKFHHQPARGHTMSSVIGFLESVGRDASLRDAGSRQWAAMMRRERVEPALRSAILRGDRDDLDALLETPHKIYCALMTPKPKAPKKAPAKKPAKPPKKKAPAKKKPAKKK